MVVWIVKGNSWFADSSYHWVAKAVNNEEVANKHAEMLNNMVAACHKTDLSLEQKERRLRTKDPDCISIDPVDFSVHYTVYSIEVEVVEQ